MIAPRFLDSNYVLALEFASDQSHAKAQAHWEGLVDASPHLVTTTLIFAEVVTFAKARKQHEKALHLGEWLRDTPGLTLLHPDEELLFEGWDYLARHRDKSYSLTDCVSFVLMRRLGITTALTFDHHFAQAGFEMLP